MCCINPCFQLVQSLHFASVEAYQVVFLLLPLKNVHITYYCPVLTVLIICWSAFADKIQGRFFGWLYTGVAANRFTTHDKVEPLGMLMIILSAYKKEGFLFRAAVFFYWEI